MIVAYIDGHRDRFGVEPICRVLTEPGMAIAPSTYYAHRAEPVSQAAWDDAHRANAALEVWRANRSLYGADKSVDQRWCGDQVTAWGTRCSVLWEAMNDATVIASPP